MTEQEWLDCPGPYLMLEFLGKRITPRKLRLFGCACCRRIWHLLPDQRSRDTVEVAERYADGLASRREMDGAYGPAGIAVQDIPGFSDPGRHWTNKNVSGYHAAWAVVWLLSENIASWQASTEAAKAVRGARGCDEEDAVSPERYQQAALLRCIVGNLFRPVTINPDWFAWKNGTIPRIASGIYEERRFENMPILADALEEAGCYDAEILAHCRGPGPHARGCWLIDALIGKE